MTTQSSRGWVLAALAALLLFSSPAPLAAWSFATRVATLPVAGVGLQPAIDGDTIAVGIPSSSRVVVFVRDSTGAWVEQATLDRTEHPPLAGRSQFGQHVALSGDDLFVAGVSDIWAFHRAAGAWTEELHNVLTTSSNNIWDVAAWNGYVFVSRGTHGLLVLYRDATGTWTYPWSSGSSSEAMHGVAVNAGVVALGYPNARFTVGLMTSRGEVSVYRISAGGGGLDPVTTLRGGAADEDFGEALGISPDGATLFVGATDGVRAGTTAPWQGACYAYSVGVSSATLVTRLEPGGPASFFGDSIGTETGFVVVGGSPVRLFALDAGEWVLQDTLVWAGDVPRVGMSGRFAVVHNEVFEIADGRGLGVACDAAEPCGRGECVDGVCCDDACGGDATDDCRACAVATGATHDGRCSPVVAAMASSNRVSPRDGAVRRGRDMHRNLHGVPGGSLRHGRGELRRRARLQPVERLRGGRVRRHRTGRL